MARDHVLEETGFSLRHGEQCLPLLGLGSKGDKVHRMAGAHGHSHLGIKFETADARSMSGAGINHHHRSCKPVHRHARRWQQTQQGIVAGRAQVATVEHQFMLEFQQRRRSLFQVRYVVVAAIEHGVQEQRGTLCGVRQIGAGAVQGRKHGRRCGRLEGGDGFSFGSRFVLL